MHCVANYPAAEAELNLQMINSCGSGMPVRWLSGLRLSVAASMIAGRDGAVAVNVISLGSCKCTAAISSVSGKARIRDGSGYIRSIREVLGDGIKIVPKRKPKRG